MKPDFLRAIANAVSDVRPTNTVQALGQKHKFLLRARLIIYHS